MVALYFSSPTTHIRLVTYLATQILPSVFSSPRELATALDASQLPHQRLYTSMTAHRRPAYLSAATLPPLLHPTRADLLARCGSALARRGGLAQRERTSSNAFGWLV